MNYHEAANFLFGLRRYPPRPGIEATSDLLEHLGDPQEGVACVQVAGSNGKGTTARMTERILREAGLSVGLYTSPHLDDVRERVRVDGRPVRKQAVTEYVRGVREYVRECGAAGEAPTFFETLTGLALWEFDRQDVDVAVLEVGIGGRYDATSAVDPVASAVTSIALEHTDFLGDSIVEIARDKAHVAPEDGPLVTATTGEALVAIEEVADDVVTVRERDEGTPDVGVEYGGARNHCEADVSIGGQDWSVETAMPALGQHQARNAGVAAVLARSVGDTLGVEVGQTALERGLRSAHWPGRFETLAEDPLVVLDGAHNPGACEALASTLDEFDYEDLHLVFGSLVDKDHAGMASNLPTPDRVVTCRPDLDRAERQETLAAVFESAGIGAVTATGSVAAALERAREAAGPDDCVVVTGSLHTVAEARRRFSQSEVPKRAESIAEARSVLEDADVTEAGAWRMRGKAVQRLVKSRVQPRQASYLKEELLSLGGECAISGVRDEEELRTVVMMGTMAQFKRLAEKLTGQPYGLSLVGDDIRRTLGIGQPVQEAGVRGGVSTADGFDWLEDTAVMGILNVTPDSFHDGGEYDVVEAAVERAERMVAEGVDVLDIGGESTRPGADPVSVEEERERVVPVVEAIREAGIDCPISVDTRKAAVADPALSAGADLVNDVSGLEDPEMRFVAADHDAGLVVMHSVETPVDPQRRMQYDDVVEDVIADLRERVLLAERAGLDRDRILVDPGLGFGKTSAESFELLDRLGEFDALGCPVLVGHSHKSMFDLLGYDHGQRLPATIATTALATERGADVIRVHDVENVAAVRAALAVEEPAHFE